MLSWYGQGGKCSHEAVATASVSLCTSAPWFCSAILGRQLQSAHVASAMPLRIAPCTTFAASWRRSRRHAARPRPVRAKHYARLTPRSRVSAAGVRARNETVSPAPERENLVSAIVESPRATDPEIGATARVEEAAVRASVSDAGEREFTPEKSSAEAGLEPPAASTSEPERLPSNDSNSSNPVSNLPKPAAPSDDQPAEARHHPPDPKWPPWPRLFARRLTIPSQQTSRPRSALFSVSRTCPRRPFRHDRDARGTEC